MAKIVDPDGLNRGTEILFDLDAKTIQLVATGNLLDTSPAVDSGVTLQAVYSVCKELWKDEADLNRFRFPLDAITEVKMDLVNGWTWADQTTVELVRDGGWSVRDGAGNSVEEYMGIISLGQFPTTDTAYYQQEAGFDVDTTDMVYSGVINEAVPVFDADGVTGFDFRDFFRLYLRNYERTYSVGDLIRDQGFTTLDYTVFRVPLSSIADINIIADDGDVDSLAPYTGMTLDYLRGNRFITWVANDPYEIDDVVQAPNGRWFRALTNHSSVATEPQSDATNWESYVGEEEIGPDNWYAFNRVLDANGGDVREIYTWMQRQLRRETDINDDELLDGFGVVRGNIARSLGAIVGDNVFTGDGLVIRNFDIDSRVNMRMQDITVDGGGIDDEFIPLTSTTRIFPFVATGNIVPNTILIDDADAEYTMYYTSVPAGDFDTVDAVIVNDADGVPLTGNITGNIPFTFDYDGNTQGGRTAGTDAPVTVVAIGLETAQYVVAEFEISRTVGLNFPINAVLERNYVGGAP